MSFRLRSGAFMSWGIPLRGARVFPEDMTVCQNTSNTPMASLKGGIFSGSPKLWIRRLKFVFFCCLVLSLIIGSLFAAPETNILVVNSNRSVRKYSLTQSEFIKKVNRPVLEVDIGAKWQDREWLEGMILDEKPEVIFCIGSKAYLETRVLAGDAHIIFSFGINWRRFPITEKTYVVATEIPPITQLFMYRFFFPEIDRIGVIYSIRHNKEWFRQALADAKDVNIQLIGFPVKNAGEVEGAVQRLLAKSNALWLIPDPLVLADRKQAEFIFQRSNKERKPVFTYDKIFADFGAAFIVSADIPTIAGQGAVIADNLLEHREVKDKIQKPAGSYIAINHGKIKKYGVKLNVKALSSVNEFLR